jgi:hypothetical protein
MTRAGWILLCFAAAAAVVTPIAVMAGSGSGFDGVVSAIEGRYHVRAERVPFIGLASLVAGGATHGGVGGLEVAEFDNFSAKVDGNELDAIVEEKLGPGWERVIRESSRRGEQTLIFMHPEGSRMGMFIVDLDGHELDVVQVSVDPDHLNESIGKYTHSHGDGKESD